MKTANLVLVSLASLALTTAAQADLVQVDIYGTVMQNNYAPSSPLHAVAVGSPAHTSFQVDSTKFLNSSSFPVRGYSIVPGTFLTMLGDTAVTLNAGVVPPQPFFSIRNNDPHVDGFLVSNGVDFVNAVPTTFSSANFSFVDSISETTLNSLNILDALGTYNASQLTLLEYDLEFGESIGIDMSYQRMTIAAVPEPATLGMFALLLPFAVRRNRRSRQACRFD